MACEAVFLYFTRKEGQKTRKKAWQKEKPRDGNLLWSASTALSKGRSAALGKGFLHLGQGQKEKADRIPCVFHGIRPARRGNKII